MRKLLIFIIPCIVVLSAPLAAPTQDIAAPVVGIYAEQDSKIPDGAGVLISPQGHILTAKHTLRGSSIGKDFVYVAFPDWEPTLAHVIRRSPDRDLAVLQILDTGNLPKPAEIALAHELRRDLADGSEGVVRVSGVGHPSPRGSLSLFERFNDKEVLGIDDETDFIIIDHQVFGGNSGGPVYRGGKLAGIVTAQAGSTTRSYAIPIDHAFALLQGVGLDPFQEQVMSYTKEILRLRRKLEELGSGLNWLETYLSWDVFVCIDRKATNELDELGLIIRYSKRYQQQKSPNKYLTVNVRPIFTEEFLEVVEKENVADIDRIVHTADETFRDAGGAGHEAYIPSIKKALSREFVQKKLHEMQDIPDEGLFGLVRQLRVEIDIESIDGSVDFADQTVMVDFDEKGALFRSCELP